MMSTSAMVKGKGAGLSPEDVETVREAALLMYGQFVTSEVTIFHSFFNTTTHFFYLQDENRVILPEPVMKRLAMNIHSKTVSPALWFDEVQMKVS